MAACPQNLKFVVSLLLLSACVGACRSDSAPKPAQSRTNDSLTSGFRWIDPQKDKAIWDKALLAFHNQLEPDHSGGLPYEYKFLNRVGLSGNTALVIVSHRTKKNEARGEYTLAFNYDVGTGQISEIANPERDEPVALYMYDWNFVKQARFDSSPNPDVVFTYHNCWECEEESILAAFQYDPSLAKWQVRSWGDGSRRWWMTRVGLVIDKDMAFSDVASYECIYGLIGPDGNGFTSVAARCRQVNSDKQEQDSTIVYSHKANGFIAEFITAKKKQQEILSVLCQRDSKNGLCEDSSQVQR